MTSNRKADWKYLQYVQKYTHMDSIILHLSPFLWFYKPYHSELPSSISPNGSLYKVMDHVRLMWGWRVEDAALKIMCWRVWQLGSWCIGCTHFPFVQLVTWVPADGLFVIRFCFHVIILSGMLLFDCELASYPWVWAPFSYWLLICCLLWLQVDKNWCYVKL